MRINSFILTLLVVTMSPSASAKDLEMTARQVRLGPDLSLSEAQKAAQKLFKLDAMGSEPILLLVGVRSGYAPAAMIVVDAIAAINSKVLAVVQAEAFGPGAIVTLFCHKRYAFPHASLLFKKPEYASKSVMKDKPPLPAKATESYLNRIVGILAKKLGMKKQVFEEKIKTGWYMTAQEAKKLGVIDQVVAKVQWVDLITETVEIKRTSTIKEKRPLPTPK